MQSGESFKILFREQWSDNDFNLTGHSFSKGGVFDPAAMRAVMDVVIDGIPLNEHPGEDSVFFLMRDLLSAAERLTTGSTSARVSFYETPFELVFKRIDNIVFLTFYRGGQMPEVIVKDRSLPLKNLISGVVESASSLIKETLKNNSSAKNDPLIQWMEGIFLRLKESLKTMKDSRNKDAGIIHKENVESSRWMEPRNEEGFSFGFRFKATSTDLLSPERPIGNDLNALLFRGQFAIHARDRRRVMGEGFLFLQVEKMLATVRKLLIAWEEGRPMSVRLISEGLSVGIKLTGDDNLTVTLSRQDDEDSVIVLNDLTPWQYADAVLGVAREIRRYIILKSPKQRKNIRIEGFSTEIRRLVALVKEQKKEALVNSDIDKYKDQFDLLENTDSGVDISNSKVLAFKESWRLEAEGLDLSSTLLCDRVTVVSAHGYILGVESSTGTVLWRRAVDKGNFRIQLAGRDGIIRVEQSGNVDMLDLNSGVLRWRTRLLPRSGGAPVVLVADQGAIPAMVIVAEEERHLVALDLRTGEIKWRYSVMRGGRFALRKQGRLLYVSSGDTQFTAIDVEDGTPVWRFPDRTHFNHLPVFADDKVYVVGGVPQKNNGKLYCLDAYSGEPVWSTSLKGTALMGPVYSDGTVLLPVRRRNTNYLIAFDSLNGDDLWSAQSDGSVMASSIGAVDDKFIVNSAGGVVMAYDAKSGKIIWHTILGPVCSDDIPLGLSVVSRGGVLFVPADTIYVVHPDNGEVIYSLGGDPPVPDLMQVTKDGAVFIAEESGHMGMYEIARSFAILDGGNK
ncbi:MAG: PQQ-binding-like beta-propeller repeat protein [Deltaproteobacteria bacterium]|nr:PQQ-binding-like beta-propeller repeat protein [Deltaproteobacteria bacterium]